MTDKVLQKRRLAEANGMKCGICNGKVDCLSDATLDHVVPKSLGGVGTIDNLQLAHWKCNQLKSVFENMNFLQKYGYIAVFVYAALILGVLRFRGITNDREGA